MTVEVQELTKIYGTQRAIDAISFSVDKGQVVGFLGPNGAGKTTTMKILTCFMPQSSGKASVCGFDVEKDSLEVRKRIGYLPEHNPLYHDMYVREYLEFAAGVHKLGKTAKTRIDEMIDRVGLSLEKHKKVGALSKGYRQRVGLAQAMLHDPEVFILDEPTSGLDPNQLAEIRQVIKDLGKEKTVILSTHIMQEVQAICDRVIIINKGKIVADDTTEHIRSQSGGGVQLSVEFKEEPDLSELRDIRGVNSAKAKGKGRYILFADADKDLRETVFQWASAKQYTLLSMQQESSSLEEVFQTITKQADQNNAGEEKAE